MAMGQQKDRQGDLMVLAGVVHEARLFHAYVRAAPGHVEIKGGHALTETGFWP